jgi:hypothetical protein
LAVRPQSNLQSNHHNCNGYFQIRNLTVGGAGSLTSPSGDQTISYTEASNLTGPCGDQTAEGSLRRPGTTSVERDTLHIFLGF